MPPVSRLRRSHHRCRCAPAWAALEARRTDAATAFVDGATGERISFAELHDRVMGIARGLVAHGLRPGDRVAMLVPPSIDLVAAVYGVWRAGGVTVIADRGLGLRGLGRAVRGAHVDWVIGPPQALAAARALRWARAGSHDRGRCSQAARRGGHPRRTRRFHRPVARRHRSPTILRRCCTPRARPARPRGSAIATASSPRNATHWPATYAITADDPLVAAFAPFALYGPALGITSTIPDVDVTAPGTLTAAALAAACASIDATIVFASPAALANVVATSAGSNAAIRPRCAWCCRRAPRCRWRRLRATAVLFPAAELHTPYGMTECLPVADISLDGIDACRPGSGRVRRSCRRRGRGAGRAMVTPGSPPASEPVAALPAGVTGEVLVRAPWLSDGYDQLWRTQHEARPRDVDGTGVASLGRCRPPRCRRPAVDRGSLGPRHPSRPADPSRRCRSRSRSNGFPESSVVRPSVSGRSGASSSSWSIEDATAERGLAAAALADAVRGAVDAPVAAVLSVRRPAGRHPPQHQDRPHCGGGMGRAGARRWPGVPAVVSERPCHGIRREGARHRRDEPARPANGRGAARPRRRGGASCSAASRRSTPRRCCGDVRDAALVSSACCRLRRSDPCRRQGGRGRRVGGVPQHQRRRHRQRARRGPPARHRATRARLDPIGRPCRALPGGCRRRAAGHRAQAAPGTPSRRRSPSGWRSAAADDVRRSSPSARTWCGGRATPNWSGASSTALEPAPGAGRRRRRAHRHHLHRQRGRRAGRGARRGGARCACVGRAYVMANGEPRPIRELLDGHLPGRRARGHAAPGAAPARCDRPARVVERALGAARDARASPRSPASSPSNSGRPTGSTRGPPATIWAGRPHVSIDDGLARLADWFAAAAPRL